MKKVISILLTVMMVAGLFAALIPTASASSVSSLNSYAQNVPTIHKKELIYAEDFEDAPTTLSANSLNQDLGWKTTTDTNEPNTPSNASAKIVETEKGKVLELKSDTWANTVIKEDDRLAGGNYYIEYTQKMTANGSSTGQGFGIVTNGIRSGATFDKAVVWTCFKANGEWHNLLCATGETSYKDYAQTLDYNAADKSDQTLVKAGAIRVRIVIDAEFGVSIYTGPDKNNMTLQSTYTEAGTAAWKAVSSSIGNQVLFRLLAGPTVQIDDIEIWSFDHSNAPFISMQGVQTTYANDSGKFDARFIAKTGRTNIDDVKSIHFEISFAGESITGSASSFITKNVYLHYVYSSLSTNLGSSSITTQEGEYFVALHIQNVPSDVIYKIKPVITFKDQTTTSGDVSTYEPEALTSNIQYMHFSFDDGYQCFDNLSTKNYDSLYDEPFFGWMKEMHDEYGAIFSVYAFNENLAAFAASENATKYQAEFQAAKSWLKIGLHSPMNNQNVNFGTNKGVTYSTIDAGYREWTTMLNSVMTITGDKDCIDLFPRLHNFAGTQNAINGMIAAGKAFAESTPDETDTAADYTPVGFLGADDNRVSYYLDSTTSEWLNANDHLTDTGKNVQFVATDIRAENVSSQCTNASNIYDELIYRHTMTKYSVSASSMIIFSHENRIQNNLNNVKETMEQAAKFAKDFGIEFAFPQDRVAEETEKDFVGTPAPDYKPVPAPEPTPDPIPGAGIITGTNKEEGLELPEIKI